MADNAEWYVLHTYSGYENTVAASIEKARENRHMEDLILEVKIPMETVTEIVDSKTVTKEHKIFPGYVLIKMIMTDESWHLVRNVRGVTGFVGSGGKAIPLTEQEILDLGVEKREINLEFSVGDSVRVIDGPLDGFIGTVDELDADKGRVRVTLSMFGRETPVDLELDQVEAYK
jgi:transcriptional antiterminator NusG